MRWQRFRSRAAGEDGSAVSPRAAAKARVAVAGWLARAELTALAGGTCLSYGSSSGDPEPLVRADLKALEKLALGPHKPAVERSRARLAWLEGDRKRALELLRHCAAQNVAFESPDDATRDRMAIGIILGGAEGEAMRAAAMQQLQDSGYVDPERELRSHFPELLG